MARIESTVTIARPPEEVFAYFLTLDENVPKTNPDDVGVLAPTDNASATLITCSGPWDPIAQTKQRRLIVSADYVAQ